MRSCCASAHVTVLTGWNIPDKGLPDCGSSPSSGSHHGPPSRWKHPHQGSTGCIPRKARPIAGVLSKVPPFPTPRDQNRSSKFLRIRSTYTSSVIHLNVLLESFCLHRLLRDLNCLLGTSAATLCIGCRRLSLLFLLSGAQTEAPDFDRASVCTWRAALDTQQVFLFQGSGPGDSPAITPTALDRRGKHGRGLIQHTKPNPPPPQMKML